MFVCALTTIERAHDTRARRRLQLFEGAACLLHLLGRELIISGCASGPNRKTTGGNQLLAAKGSRFGRDPPRAGCHRARELGGARLRTRPTRAPRRPAEAALVWPRRRLSRRLSLCLCAGCWRNRRLIRVAGRSQCQAGAGFVCRRTQTPTATLAPTLRR